MIGQCLVPYNLFFSPKKAFITVTLVPYNLISFILMATLCGLIIIPFLQVRKLRLQEEVFPWMIALNPGCMIPKTMCFAPLKDSRSEDTVEHSREFLAWPVAVSLTSDI